MKSTIHIYLEGLQSANEEKIISLFSDHAMIHSPLYGDKFAKEFFKVLFADTFQSEIKLLNIFQNPDRPGSYAAHFNYTWTLKNGAISHLECVDIFQFDELGKIIEMTIIYDTYQTRRHVWRPWICETFHWWLAWIWSHTIILEMCVSATKG